MHRTRAILAFILIAVGLVWVGQGVGMIPGSVMSGQALWAWIGAALILVGIAVAALEIRSRRAETR